MNNASIVKANVVEQETNTMFRVRRNQQIRRDCPQGEEHV